MFLKVLLHIAQRWISGEILRKSIISNPTERIVLTILDENNFCLCSHGGTRTQYATNSKIVQMHVLKEYSNIF